MELIVAVDRNWAIGKKGHLLFSIPDDMRHFREMTLGRAIVYGRETLKTFPGEKPLPGRLNYVLTHHPDTLPEGCVPLTSADEIPQDEAVFVVGGGSVYQQLLPECVVAHVTFVDMDGGGDVFFPDLNASDDWVLVSKTDTMCYEGLTYRFCTYIRM